MQGTNLTTSQPSSFTNTSISSTFSAANFTFQPIQSLPPFNSSSNLSKRALEEYLEETLGKRHKDLSEAVSLSIIYCVIFVTGVVGNTCTAAIVMRRPSMRTPTNFYLCSLALSDVITLIIGTSLRSCSPLSPLCASDRSLVSKHFQGFSNLQ